MLLENIISTNEKDFYMYSLEIFEMYVITYLLVLLISVFLQDFFVTVYFIIHFHLLRNYTGGFHFNKKKQCISFTVIIMSIIPIILKIRIVHFCNYMFFVLSGIFLLLNAKFCPVVSKNKMIDELGKKRIRKKAMFMLIFLCIEYLLVKNLILKNLLIACLLLNIVNIVIGKFFELNLRKN